MKKYIFFFISFYFSLPGSGQVKNYKQLLSLAIPYWAGTHVVKSKPFTGYRLSQSEIAEYRNALGSNAALLTEQMLNELIENSKKPDSTLWTDTELKNVILVPGRTAIISDNYLRKKFSGDSDSIFRQRDAYVKYFNNEDQGTKSILSFSRPIFDNSRKFALVCSDKGHATKVCRGMINLYHYENNRWIWVGEMYNCTL